MRSHPLFSSALAIQSGRSSAHIARAGEHSDGLGVISASQTPSFTQLRSPNPRLAVLFSGRLLSNSPALNQKHITLHAERFMPVASQLATAQDDDGGQVVRINKENEEMSKELQLRDHMDSEQRGQEHKMQPHLEGFNLQPSFHLDSCSVTFKSLMFVSSSNE
ncbi:unnamed protein product [Pleuronectes platessa]|uniref:Uncharacterized protein n=1 Tax=Pleuronectes platessa TaxID=8262 RepID=A0A9N7VNR4_PLEPL|nr:unnamed protein product [Pleuronectes platessa]